MTPSSGVLTTINSQTERRRAPRFQSAKRLTLRDRGAARGGFKAVVIRVRLTDGRLYEQIGQLNFVNNTIAQNTGHPPRCAAPSPTLPCQICRPSPALRELTDNEFVTVLLEGVRPVEVLAIPRSAVLSDQQGEYVHVVAADNKAELRGSSWAIDLTIAAVTSGISLGEKVIVEGLRNGCGLARSSRLGQQAR